MTAFSFISMIFVVSGLVSCLIIFMDTRKHKQPMTIMGAVWPLTGLWASWAGLWAYYRFGRAKKAMDGSMPGMDMDSMPDMDMSHQAPPMQMDKGNMDNMIPPSPTWQQISLSTLHCGAGCTLADLAGEWFTFFIPLSIGSSLIAGQWVFDYLLALATGILFQYLAIRQMENLPARQILKKAFKADVLSLTSWQIGMYGWMAIVIFLFSNGLSFPKTSWEFWFMMQIAMLLGFITAYPVNRLLIKKGIKKGM